MARGETRRRLLDALASCDTIASAAKEVGISRRRVYDYLSDPAFAQEYQAARRIATDKWAARLADEREHAILVLIELMDDEQTPAATRLRCAERLLIQADAAHDRVDALAQAINKETQQKRYFKR